MNIIKETTIITINNALYNTEVPLPKYVACSILPRGVVVLIFWRPALCSRLPDVVVCLTC